MHKLISIASAGVLAATLFVGGATNAQVGVDVKVGGGASSSEASVNGNADVTVGVDEHEDDDSHSHDDSSSEAAPASGISLNLTQKEAASASIDAESAELGAASVVTGEDLNLYATAQLKRDANLKTIKVEADHVTVVYRKNAHFLGFIPTGIHARATVTSSGDVDIDYPWYRFLFAVEGASDTEAELLADVHGVLEANASAGTGFTVAQEAELIERIHASLSGMGSVEVDVTSAGGIVPEGSSDASQDAADGVSGGVSGSASGDGGVYPQ